MKKSEQRIKNQFNIINFIRSKKKISQADLSVLCKMQPSSISYIINNLKNQKIVKENGKKKSTKSGGKRANLLSLNPQFGYFGSIYIKNTSILFNLFDFSGKIIQSFARNLKKIDKDEIIKHILEEINNWQKKYDYKATGIILSYIVDNKGNILFDSNKYDPMMEFNQSLQHLLPQNQTIIIENDANCSAFYSQEKFQNKYNTLLNFLVYFNPFRFGCGIIIDKKLYRGTFGAAGEIVNFDNNKIIFDFKNSEKNITFLKYFEDLLVSHAIFLDSDAVILSGDINKMPQKVLEEFKTNLQKKLPNSFIDFSDRDFPVISGGALLIIRKYLKEKVI